MTEEARYTIGALADAAGVTPRTIRYYTAEGLLPPPDTRGRYALYGEEHVLRLRLIARLKESYLPLGEIKARLEQLDLVQLRQLLAATPQVPQQALAESAAEYITNVLNNQTTPAPSGRSGQQQSEAVMQAATPQSGVFTKDRAEQEKEIRPPAAPPLQVGHAQPLSSPAPSQRGSLLSRLVPPRPAKREAQQTSFEESEQWQRVALASGVELHIRQPLSPEQRKWVEEVAAQARQLFEDEE